jgi:hypothetical protein
MFGHRQAISDGPIYPSLIYLWILAPVETSFWHIDLFRLKSLYYFDQVWNLL